MSLTYLQARTQIRTATAHDVDAQVSDTQLDSWLDQEVAQLRRMLISVAPTLYQRTAPTQTPAVNSWFDLAIVSPAVERVWRFERLYGSTYIQVPVSDEASPEADFLNYRETTNAGSPILLLAPSREALGGTYRLIYHPVPAASTVEVPTGCEDVVIQRVAGRVAMRLFDDPAPFFALADRVWTEQRRALRRRYGAQPQPGLRLTKGW